MIRAHRLVWTVFHGSVLGLAGSSGLISRAHAQTAPQTYTQIFTYTGRNQTFAVPPGVSSLFLRLWGAGGGGKGGGGGAFVSGSLSVTPSSALTLIVGGAGNNGRGGFGGGGDSARGAGGGGRSAIVLGNTEVVDAGGGGGANNNLSRVAVNGGAGGLVTGLAGSTATTQVVFCGGGGTQTAGGSAGIASEENGTAGSQWQGGAGYNDGDGGGGGGGYYGGGGGGLGVDSSNNLVPGAGGGGSSLTFNLTGFVGQAGNGATPGGMNNPFYLSGVGAGNSSGGDNWGNGEIALTYALSQPNVVVAQPTEAALNAALAQVAQGGTITFACDGTIPITSAKRLTISSSSAPITVTLDATGHNITLDGGGKTALFSARGNSLNSKASWIFKHLTLTRSAGSAVNVNYGDVSAFNCAFLNNQAAIGGAIFASLGTTLLSDCLFAGNSATSAGGAVWSGSSGYITRCAFLNNAVSATANNAATGGALALASTAAAVNLTNCTFVGNRSLSASGNAYGGAIYTDTADSTTLTNCTLTNCTLAANSAIGGNGYGGAVSKVNNAAITLVNTIVADNVASTSGSNANGAVTDGGHNLCSDASCAFTDPTSKNSAAARLGSLVYTGGSVPTLSLLANSPAIDAGDDSKAPATDARGAARVGSHSDIGAYERSVWQADASAAAPDGTTRLLWNRSDGLCNLWSVDANNNVVQSFDYGPYAGWTAVSVSVGSDNNTRLLWQHSSGAINVWSVDTAGGSGAVLASVHYGPYAGWTLNTLATGADNHTRLLWRNQDGTANVWNVDTRTGTDAATLLSSTHYGPFAGWTATGLAVGSDNHTRLLWTYQDGTANVWNVDTGLGVDAATLLSSAHYVPSTGWTATNLSVGADNNTRLQWNNVDGTLNLWNLQIGAGVDNSVVLSSPMYGPYLDFACTGSSVGADNQARLLWNHTDGMLDLWRVNGSGNFLSSFHFGPY